MVIRWLIFVFTVLIALLYLSGVFYFWEPDDIKKGSPAYYLKLPKEVREFDYYQLIDDVTFSYRVADGVKPTIITAKFMQSTPFYSFRHQLVKAGFQCQGIAESPSIRCAGKYVDGRVLFITRRLRSEETEVEVTFVGVGDS